MVQAKSQPVTCHSGEAGYWLAFTTVLVSQLDKRKYSPGQLTLPWSRCQVSECPLAMEVAQKFIQANQAFKSDV